MTPLQAVEIIEDCFGKAGCPLSEDQKIILAGTLSVIIPNVAMNAAASAVEKIRQPKPSLSDAPSPPPVPRSPWPFPKTIP